MKYHTTLPLSSIFSIIIVGRLPVARSAPYRQDNLVSYTMDWIEDKPEGFCIPEEYSNGLFIFERMELYGVANAGEDRSYQ